MTSDLLSECAVCLVFGACSAGKTYTSAHGSLVVLVIVPLSTRLLLTVTSVCGSVLLVCGWNKPGVF